MSSSEPVATLALPQLEISRVEVPASAAALEDALGRPMFDQAPFSTVIYDAQGHPLAVNPAFQRMWGVAMESVPPGYSVLADPELERSGVLPLVRRAFEEGETVVTPPVRYDISQVSTSGGGHVLWTQGYFYPVRGEDGRLSHVVLTHFDLTEQKEAEQALREQEERMRLAQRAAGIGTFDWDVPRGRVAWTEEEERIFGIAPGSFGGTIEAWGEFVLPDDLVRMQGELAGAMERGETYLDFGFRIRRPDREVRWIEGSGQFFYDEHGTPLRMVGVNLDVTERRRAEEERRRSALLLREMERIARIGSWEWDLATGTVTWSDELYRVYGLDRTQGPIDSRPFCTGCTPTTGRWCSPPSSGRCRTTSRSPSTTACACATGPCARCTAAGRWCWARTGCRCG